MSQQPPDNGGNRPKPPGAPPAPAPGNAPGNPPRVPVGKQPTPIAGEHPLTLYVDKQEIVTLMTLGAAPEALAIGFLRNQRLVDSLDQIASVQVDWDVNAVVVTTNGGLGDLEAKTGKRTATTGCGQGTVFGDLMADIENLTVRPSQPGQPGPPARVRGRIGRSTAGRRSAESARSKSVYAA